MQWRESCNQPDKTSANTDRYAILYYTKHTSLDSCRKSNKYLIQLIVVSPRQTTTVGNKYKYTHKQRDSGRHIKIYTSTHIYRAVSRAFTCLAKHSTFD